MFGKSIFHHQQHKTKVSKNSIHFRNIYHFRLIFLLFDFLKKDERETSYKIFLAILYHTRVGKSNIEKFRAKGITNASYNCI